MASIAADIAKEAAEDAAKDAAKDSATDVAKEGATDAAKKEGQVTADDAAKSIQAGKPLSQSTKEALEKIGQRASSGLKSAAEAAAKASPKTIAMGITGLVLAGYMLSHGITNPAEALARLSGDTTSAFFVSLFGKNWKWWLFGGVGLFMILIIIILLLK